MTPKRPTELVSAAKAIAEAHAIRNAMIDAGDTVGVRAMNEACDILDEMFSSRYQQWQILGGTSNVDSITYPEPCIDYEHADWLDEQETRESERPY